MIERISRLLDQAAGKRFYLIYGSGAGDSFIDMELSEKSIEDVLLMELRQRGFDRVVYVAPHRSIYFKDEQSEKLTWPSPPTRETRPNPGVMRVLESGPLELDHALRTQV